MERSIRYNFLIDLESIQHKVSSDSPYKPLQNVNFWKVGNTQLFFQEL